MKDNRIKQYHEAEDYFFRALSKDYLDIDRGSTAFLTGVKTASLNPVYIQTISSEIKTTLDVIRDYYQSKQMEYIICIPETAFSMQMKTELYQLGYQHIETSTAMMLDFGSQAVDHNVNKNTAVTIKEDNENLNDWLQPLVKAFETPYDLCLQYKMRHHLALKKKYKIEHMVLYKSKKPVSCLTFSMNSGLARIDDVGTLPEYQGQGHASTLLRHTVIEAKKAGALYCFLESANTEFSIYKKIGFQKLFTYLIFQIK